ncbi:MAG: UDP-glucose/GDP-mannose dehydrogenase family protein [Archaeoglobaceae archaeon]
MKLAVIGAGYVGLVTGIGFASLGHEITFVDVDAKKVEMIGKAEPPLYEKGLKELMKNLSNYRATTEFKEIEDSEIVFICVGTPFKDEKKMDLSQLESAALEISKYLSRQTIVVRSTVLPGTTENLIPIFEKYGKKAFADFGIAYNPEFLREGNALQDFFNPDRIVVGAEDERSKKILSELYRDFNCPKIFTNIKTAEMIKLVANAFLSTKISFANEIGNVCKKLGIDCYEVFEAVGLDHRISPHFFKAGLGFGGSCLPKDLKALISKAVEVGEEPRILKAVLEVNESQPLRMIEILKKHLGSLEGKKIGVLGLAFKPETDDVRDARSMVVVSKLLEEGAEIVAYDPKAMENFRKIFPNIEYRKSALEVIEEAEAILIVTEWSEFEGVDCKGKLVVDGRRVKVKNAKYEGVCW